MSTTRLSPPFSVVSSLKTIPYCFGTVVLDYIHDLARALKFGTLNLDGKSIKRAPVPISSQITESPRTSSMPACSALVLSSQQLLNRTRMQLWTPSAPPQILYGHSILFGPASHLPQPQLLLGHGIPVSFGYDRKEVKDDGEGGKVVGISIEGKRGCPASADQ